MALLMGTLLKLERVNYADRQMTPPLIDVNVKAQQLNIKAEEFVPNNSIEVIYLEKDDNVTDVDNEVSLGNKPISDPRTDDSEKECNLPNKLDVVSRQLTGSDGVYIAGQEDYVHCRSGCSEICYFHKSL